MYATQLRGKQMLLQLLILIDNMQRSSNKSRMILLGRQIRQNDFDGTQKMSMVISI